MPPVSLTYRFAGLDLASCVALPELPRASQAGPAAFQIQLSPTAGFPDGAVDWRHAWRDATGAEVVLGARRAGRLFLRFAGVCEAAVDGDGRIDLWRDPAAGEVSLRHMLLDQILPRALAQQGHLMLHGGLAVLADHRGLLVVGDTGAGKSTLCAALAATGLDLVTDDCVRLEVADGTARAFASYRGLRLLPDSLAALHLEGFPDTQPMAEYSAKRRLLPGSRDPLPAVPVAAVVVLRPPVADARITLTRLPPGKACMALVTNSFQLDPGDMTRVRGLLAQAAAASRQTAVYALAYPREYARLPQVIARIQSMLA